MTDNKISSSKEQKSTLENAAEKTASAAPQPSVKPSLSQKTNTVTRSNKSLSIPISKLAIFSCLLALLSLAGLGGGYSWLTQQQLILQSSISDNTAQQLLAKEASTQKLLANQQKQFDDRIANISQAIEAENQQTINQLKRTVDRLSATQPTDWLMHEAEYLIRVAGRTIWLEKDTSAAIKLLSDANQRLKTLKSPKFLKVRAAIYNDIEQLKLIPTLNTEDIVLTLAGLSQQIDNLPLAQEYHANESKTENSVELSKDNNDWQENLAKTWQRFIDDFITVRRRSDSDEPLLTAKQRENLFINLQLKFEQAKWSVIKEKETLYLRLLNDIQVTITTYFNMEYDLIQRFLSEIEQLKKETVSYNYPSDLTSLSAIRQVINGHIVNEIVEHNFSDEVLPVVNSEESSLSSEKAIPLINEVEKNISTTQEAEKSAPESLKQIDNAEEKKVSEKSNEAVI